MLKEERKLEELNRTPCILKKKQSGRSAVKQWSGKHVRIAGGGNQLRKAPKTSPPTVTEGRGGKGKDHCMKKIGNRGGGNGEDAPKELERRSVLQEQNSPTTPA